jgi:hypothetical protein
MQQMFFHQYNRRYAFGVVISQHTLMMYMFDRSSAVSSPSIDYHAQPEQFCAIVAGLASMQEARLGLDTSIWSDEKNRIRTKDTTKNK